MAALTRISLLLVFVGAVNWGLIGLFQFDPVAVIFGGGEQSGVFARIIYTLVGISGLLSLPVLFKPGEKLIDQREPQTER